MPQRHVLAEGDTVNLVVAAGHHTARLDHDGGVVTPLARVGAQHFGIQPQQQVGLPDVAGRLRCAQAFAVGRLPLVGHLAGRQARRDLFPVVEKTGLRPNNQIRIG